MGIEFGQPEFHDHNTNESVVVSLPDPAGAKSMVITFGYFDAGNDWWWAIDNLKVFQAYSVGSVEGFDGLALGPNVDEELAGDAVWTKTPPGGWSIDDSGVPGVGIPDQDGVTEWAGWSLPTRTGGQKPPVINAAPSSPRPVAPSPLPMVMNGMISLTQKDTWTPL